jgi:hypothetical protein
VAMTQRNGNPPQGSHQHPVLRSFAEIQAASGS